MIVLPRSGGYFGASSYTHDVSVYSSIWEPRRIHIIHRGIVERDHITHDTSV